MSDNPTSAENTSAGTSSAIHRAPENTNLFPIAAVSLKNIKDMTEEEHEIYCKTLTQEQRDAIGCCCQGGG